MGGFTHSELAARLAEQAALAGGGLSTGVNELDAATTIEVTDGALSLQASNVASGVVAISGAQGTTIGVGSEATSAIVMHVAGGDDTLTWAPGSFDLEIDTNGVGSGISVEPAAINIQTGGDDSNVNITAGGGGTTNVGLTGTNITLTATGLGFYGSGPAPRATIPLTGPTLQQVIDALVSYGLVLQSD